MVSLAHKFAFESPQIKTEAISSVAMPDLARMYGILGTPHLVLNGKIHLKGRLKEAQILEAVQHL